MCNSLMLQVSIARGYTSTVMYVQNIMKVDVLRNLTARGQTKHNNEIQNDQMTRG